MRNRHGGWGEVCGWQVGFEVVKSVRVLQKENCSEFVVGNTLSGSFQEASFLFLLPCMLHVFLPLGLSNTMRKSRPQANTTVLHFGMCPQS